jgi:hypothetical protein
MTTELLLGLETIDSDLEVIMMGVTLVALIVIRAHENNAVRKLFDNGSKRSKGK